MKNLLKNILCIGLITTFWACEDLTEVNMNPNSPEQVSSNYILTYVLSNTAKTYHNLGYENSKIAGAMQYVQRGTNEGAVVVNFYGWGHESWNSYFDILRNNQVIYENAVDENNDFFKGIALIIRSFHYGLMSDLYGDIPYSSALQANNDVFFPIYDRQIDVYNGILVDLREADAILQNLDPTKDVVNATSDIMYGGDAQKWRRFANALRMRYSMRLINKKSDMASLGIDLDKEFNEASQFTFMDNSDDAKVNFLGTDENNATPGGPLNSPNPNLLLKPAQTLVDKLIDLNDPRLYRWVLPVQYKWDDQVTVEKDSVVTNILGESATVRFKPAPDGVAVNTNLYVGLPVGLPIVEAMSYNKGDDEEGYHPERSPYISYLHERYRKNQDSYVSMNLITYSEIKFLMAEAALLGGLGANDPEAHYKEGIRASMEKYGILSNSGDFNFDTYYEQEAVSYAKSTNKAQRIIDQKWIANWQNPQAWFDWRRTGYPVLEVGPVTQFGAAIPVRYMYPSPNLDPNYLVNYEQAISSLEDTQFIPAGQSKDHPYAKMWLLQNSAKPW
ncbi:SusD/RagB family nutrient-binding outer membrane lipoprotein [uncultured Cyclobacterium sp.]|uniref:SusD/RagB family nutrient-binding outer membrane lipoprotein n=1 Tax=uncultured Cyclobacterium sp. TaxID=453820 RepID=UPI0030EB8865|tara:strand:+ start:183849 stop:185525 length:1677 start_codon:yes stop_codon:yes gene_type:complete